MSDMALIQNRLPAWTFVVGALGTAWNVFGLVQLADFVTQTQASLMMQGMSPAAAQLYYGLPDWMKLAFAAGSIGGLVGSLLLLARHRTAIPILAISLAGYLALFAGDYAHGVFEAIPGQLAVLLVVVAMAVLLLGAGLFAGKRGWFEPNGRRIAQGSSSEASP